MTVRSVGTLPFVVREHALGQEVAIGGRICVHSVPDVRLLLHDVIDTGTGDVLLHLGDAEIGDATGLGVPLVSFILAKTGSLDWVFIILAAAAGIVTVAGLLLPSERKSQTVVEPAAAE